MGDLTTNFSLNEFLVSSKATELGIANTPTAEHLKRLREVTAPSIQRVRDLAGVSINITSAYRNPQINAAVGGTPTSDHPQAWAVDCNAAGFSLLGFARFVRDHMRPGEALEGMIDQLIYERDRTVHISFASRRRGQVRSQHGGPNTPLLRGIVP